MRDRCRGAASGNTKRSENGPASGSPWRRRVMPWFSSRPPGRSRRATCRAYRSMSARADVLDHADAGHRVERLAARARGSRRRGCRRGPRGRARRRDGARSSACGSESVMPVTCTPCSRGRVDREASPAAADVEHPLARAQRAASCTPARASAPAPPRAWTHRARRARSCRSSTDRGTGRRTRPAGRSGGARRARRARGCGAARGAQLRRRRPWRAAADRRRGRPRAAAAPAPRGRSAAAASCPAVSSAASMSSTSSSPDT